MPAVSDSRRRRMMKRGEIPARKVGRLWRTDETVFNTWLQEGDQQNMNEPRITTDPNIAFGKPTIEGTRIYVALIIEELGAGTTIEEIMDNYDLTREQVQAAIEFARKAVEATTQGGQKENKK